MRGAKRRSNPGSLTVFASRPWIASLALAMTHSRDACAPESCQRCARTGLHKEGRRSAGRRVTNRRATLADVAIRECFGRGARHGPMPLRAPSACGRARLAALRCGSRRRANHARLGPGRASRDEDAKELPPCLCIALKPSTWLAGHSAGGDDARTARERLARPPAGTALAPPSGSHPESTLRETSGGASTRRPEIVKEFIPSRKPFDPARFFAARFGLAGEQR